jgi:tetratricopeptide (TPR) repeat protein
MLSKQATLNLLAWLCLAAPLFISAIWYWDDVSSGNWPTTVGDVESKERTPIFWIPTRRAQAQFRLNYSYSLNGKSQQGHTDWDLRPSQADKAMQDWKSGDALGNTTPIFKNGQVVVFYHPQFSNISTIAPGSCLPTHGTGLALSGFFFIIALGSVIFYRGRGGVRIDLRDLGSSVSQAGDEMFSQALLHASQGEDKKAIACFDKFISYADKAGPGVDSFRVLNVAKSYLRRGEILNKQGKYEDAVGDFDKAIALFESNQPQNECLIEAGKARAEAVKKLTINT